MYTRIVTILTAAMLCPIVGAQPQVEGKEQLMYEDFSDGMVQWWVEGGEHTWVKDNSLHMKADPKEGKEGHAVTAWFQQEMPADVRVTFDAHIINSSQGVNNINFFLHYSDPSGKPLYETRESRASGTYSLYHHLNGYIFTFVAGTRKETLALSEEQRPARIRIRRCPGFRLIAETYAYHNRAGHTYHMEIVKRGGQIVFSVDGNELLRAEDATPHQGGLLGLRTFRTYLRWSNIKVTSLESEGK